MVIRWSKQAIESLRNIFRFYQPQTGADTARRIVGEIRNETRYLLIFPEMGSREIINGQPSDYRYIVKHHCKLFYLIYADHVLIAFVWDTRRNPQYLESLLNQ